MIWKRFQSKRFWFEGGFGVARGFHFARGLDQREDFYLKRFWGYYESLGIQSGGGFAVVKGFSFAGSFEVPRGVWFLICKIFFD